MNLLGFYIFDYFLIVFIVWYIFSCFLKFIEILFLIIWILFLLQLLYILLRSTLILRQSTQIRILDIAYMLLRCIILFFKGRIVKFLALVVQEFSWFNMVHARIINVKICQILVIHFVLLLRIIHLICLRLVFSLKQIILSFLNIWIDLLQCLIYFKMLDFTFMKIFLLLNLFIYL